MAVVACVTAAIVLLFGCGRKTAPCAGFALGHFPARGNAGIWFVWAGMVIVLHCSAHYEKCTYKNGGLLSLDNYRCYCDLFGNNQLFHAVAAYQVDDLGCSATVATFGADIFAGTAWLFRSGFRSCTAVAALGERSEYIQQVKALDHLEILPALLLYKIQKFKGGAGNCPAVFRMMLDFQTVGFCDMPEILVVVHAVVAGIFYTVFGAILVYHLMN